jgi:hypothetical protein
MGRHVARNLRKIYRCTKMSWLLPYPRFTTITLPLTSGIPISSRQYLMKHEYFLALHHQYTQSFVRTHHLRATTVRGNEAPENASTPFIYQQIPHRNDFRKEGKKISRGCHSKISASRPELIKHGSPCRNKMGPVADHCPTWAVSPTYAAQSTWPLLPAPPSAPTRPRWSSIP